jgi:hypothetical protein
MRIYPDCYSTLKHAPYSFGQGTLVNIFTFTSPIVYVYTIDPADVGEYKIEQYVDYFNSNTKSIEIIVRVTHCLPTEYVVAPTITNYIRYIE